MTLEIAYLCFAIAGIFAMISVHYFVDVIRPYSKRFIALDNLIVFHNGFSQCNSKGEGGSS